MTELGKDRRTPEASDPALMGVVGGRRLSKNSGESKGPKVTLLRALFLEGSSSSKRDLEKTEVLLLLLSRLRFLLCGEKVDSSVSSMEARDAFLELREALKEEEERCRKGIGVSLFDGAMGVAGRDDSAP